MRKFTTFILLILLLLSQFSRVFVYAGFELNQKYIASTLCMNRDKPELHCNGKCYLLNKLKQAEEKEKRQEREVQKQGESPFFIVRACLPALFPLNFPRAKFCREQPFCLPEQLTEILHPPPIKHAFIA